MLTERYDLTTLQQSLLPRQAWAPFPPARDRRVWEELQAVPLNAARRDALLAEADTLLGQPWPSLPATLYMEFARTGNRSNYEKPYFTRRQRLSTLVLAECLQHQGRYLDEIINGMWAISEEASWCIPAHANRLSGDVLPRQDLASVDLFACETAMVLAEADYLLHEELAAVSPTLVARIQREVLQRVVEPVETRDDFWWLAGQNNWTPWCASNVLGAACYLLDDHGRLAALTHKLMAVVDRFTSGYGADGGCDEGPGYWAVAAGAMLMFLELLHSRTDGAVDIYHEPLIRAMGEFIAVAHLDGPWFVNFADAPARVNPPNAVTYRYGERIGSPAVQNLALLSMHGWQAEWSVNPRIAHRNGGSLTHHLREFFWIPAGARPTDIPCPTSSWLPDIQVLVARESPQPGEGLVLAAKGGHNGENHNHNDVGQFIVMLDGQPGIIDIGVETYTQQTFSDRRYELWCIRASGHNVPLVNGVEQAAGHERRATGVSFSRDGACQRLSLSMNEAYPAEAGLRALRRDIHLDGDASTITIADTIEMREGIAHVSIPLHTLFPVTKITPGCLAIGTTPRRLLICFDPALLQATITPVELVDTQLRGNWGPALTRVTLEHTGNLSGSSYALTLRAEG
ncbi:MAG: heparinase II/III domain-containing protein [Armatimonadota bacterium]